MLGIFSVKSVIRGRHILNCWSWPIATAHARKITKMIKARPATLTERSPVAMALKPSRTFSRRGKDRATTVCSFNTLLSSSLKRCIVSWTSVCCKAILSLTLARVRSWSRSRWRSMRLTMLWGPSKEHELTRSDRRCGRVYIQVPPDVVSGMVDPGIPNTIPTSWFESSDFIAGLLARGDGIPTGWFAAKYLKKEWLKASLMRSEYEPHTG